MNTKYILMSGILLSAVLNTPCYAEIYKYKDKQGNWQYSDKPPKGESTKVYINNKKNHPAENTDKTTTDLAPSHTTDLKALLYKKYKPGNSIEQASLATVSIETHLAIGSGFFISQDGYILTNKHVVRPSASDSWQETNKKYNEQKKEYKKNQRILDDEAEHLEAMYDDLKTREIEIEKENIHTAREYLIARYNTAKTDYLNRKQHYNKMKTQFDKRKRVFTKERSNFNIKSSMANVTKTFKIILKNETELTARLIAVSKEHDLALLKLDKHTTPYIKINKQRVHQTMEVYAVGSPLGIRDSVTSGIITGTKEGYVLTDTKILPGNSGGPLLSKDGEAIGVNTARVSQFVNSEGLGIAIPMKIAKKEFAKYLSLN